MHKNAPKFKYQISTQLLKSKHREIILSGLLRPCDNVTTSGSRTSETGGQVFAEIF